jgi:hypothetical protein
MTPKIIFRYSWIYDKNCEEWSRTHRTWKYPSPEKSLNFIKKVEPLWRKQERKVLRELSKITGLSWKEKTIAAYVVGSIRAFSDPLTLRIRKYPNDYIDTLIHELIHQLFTQDGNRKQWQKGWIYLFRKYKKESQTTRIHIPLHAIHEHIFRKFFGEKRLQREILGSQKFKDYRRSWAIVRKEGYGNIIQAIKERATK